MLVSAERTFTSAIPPWRFDWLQLKVSSCGLCAARRVGWIQTLRRITHQSTGWARPLSGRRPVPCGYGFRVRTFETEYAVARIEQLRHGRRLAEHNPQSSRR